MNLLIIEDEEQLSNSIARYLEADGYHCEKALTFEQAQEKIGVYQYDCILVDITLPDGNGLKIIEKLKKEKVASGVIIISARNALDDKLTGLEIGADDYITKPFDLAELNARVKALIRRRNFDGQNEVVFNEIRLVPESRKVTVKDQEVKLTKKEFDLLLFFISNPNRVITKETIAEHLWGDFMDASDSFDFIYAHIKNLRKKIMDQGGGDYIQTVYGIGYKFLEA